ncbi:MAG: ArnT family glycosyltransferase [Anaerolineae bacterium]
MSIRGFFRESEIWREAFFWLFLAVLLAGFLVGERGLLDFFGWDYDEGVYMMSARLLCAGYRLDVPSLSMPLFLASIALAFKMAGSTGTVGRLVVLMYSLLGILAMAFLARKTAERLAGLFASLMLAFSAEFYFNATRCMGEIPAISLDILSFYLAILYWQSGRRLWLMLAGLTLALSLANKPLTPFLTLLLALICLSRPGEKKRIWVDLLALVLSFLIPLALIWFIWGAETFVQVIAFFQAAKKAYPVEITASFSIFSVYLYANLGLFPLALYGLIFSGQKRHPGIWGALGWFCLAFITLMWYTPLQRHLFIILTPPLALLAGIGVEEMFRWMRERILSLKRAGAFFLGFAALSFYIWHWPTTQAEVEKMKVQIAQGWREQAAIDFLRLYSRPEDFVISDDQMLPFLAERNVPPPLTDTSKVRLSVGQPTLEELKTLTEEYKPAAILFWSERFSTYRPDYEKWVEERYLKCQFYDHYRYSLYIPRLETLPEETIPLEIAFGDKIKLVGYEISPSESLRLTLYWQRIGAVEEDYTVFVHLIDEEGNKIAQADGQPVEGFLMTSAWPPGEIIPDRREIPAPQGRYRLLAGMYLPSTMERLPITDGEGKFQDGSILLSEVTIPAP